MADVRSSKVQTSSQHNEVVQPVCAPMTGDMELAELVAVTCTSGRILHVGAGSGAVVRELLKRGRDAYGTDVQATMALAGKTAPGRFVPAESSRLPFPDAAFDCVVISDSGQAIDSVDWSGELDEACRVCARQIAFDLNDSTVLRKKDALPYADRSAIESALFARGFRRHPAQMALGAHFSHAQIGDRFVGLYERRPIHAAVGSVDDYALKPWRELQAQLEKYDWAAGFVRPGDIIFDMTPAAGAGPYLLAYQSEAAQVRCKVVNGCEDYFVGAYACCDSRLGMAGDRFPRADNPSDFVVCLDGDMLQSDQLSLLQKLAGCVTPGGRCLVSALSTDAAGSGGILQLADEALRAGWYLEQVFVLTGSHDLNRGNSRYHIVGHNWQAQVSHGEMLFVWMRAPFSTQIAYRESVYGDTEKPAQILAFERDYRNPWLLRSLVEFPFRARNPQVLDCIAGEVLKDRKNDRTPDAAAALAVKGYQLLSSTAVLARDVDRFVRKLDRFLAVSARSAHLQRWRISLTYLRACLLRAVGRLDDALASFDMVLAADWRSFSPTIGTKLVDAAYDAGQLLVTSGKWDAARDRWKRGVVVAFEMLSCGIDGFVGDLAAPQQFPGIVAVELLDSATRCVKALRWDSAPSPWARARLYEQSQQCWKWMIAERTKAIVDMEKRIQSRDVALADQAILIETRWSAMQRQEAMVSDRDATIASQAKLLDERWVAMQQQEAMVSDRDATIVSQAKLLDERWVAMQQQEAMVSDRDAAIASQAKLLDERWTAMQQQDAAVKTRDETIAAQANTLLARDAELRKRDEQIRQLNAVIDNWRWWHLRKPKKPTFRD